jgi:hypothetical protein
MSIEIRKIKHRLRKHFVTRDHGHYFWGDAAAQEHGNVRYPRSYAQWGQRGPGRKISHMDTRSKREMLNAAERSDVIAEKQTA